MVPSAFLPIHLSHEHRTIRNYMDLSKSRRIIEHLYLDLTFSYRPRRFLIFPTFRQTFQIPSSGLIVFEGFWQQKRSKPLNIPRDLGVQAEATPKAPVCET
jgi:hypothetical protein